MISSVAVTSIYSVASLAEAWIEIFWVPADGMVPMVASLAEAWIEISDIIYQAVTGGSRLPRGGVD